MQFRVVATRFGHDLRVDVERTPTGWHFRCPAGTYEGSPSGNPGLSTFFDRFAISYPSALPLLMEELWHRSRSGNWTDEQVQRRLDRLSAWISDVERSTPDDSWLA